MLDKFTNSYKLLLISLLGAVFIIYINIAYFPWNSDFWMIQSDLSYILFFIYRYFFFSILIWILLLFNLRKINSPVFKTRLGYTLLITGTGYLVYIGISFLSSYKADCFTGTLLFQFFVTWILVHLLDMFRSYILKKEGKSLR